MEEGCPLDVPFAHLVVPTIQKTGFHSSYQLE